MVSAALARRWPLACSKDDEIVFCKLHMVKNSILLRGEHFETVAGFVLDVLGHIPSEGEQFEYGGLRFEVVEMKNLKVETVRLTKPEPQQPKSMLSNDHDAPR